MSTGFDRLAVVTGRLDSYVRDRLAAACYERSAVDADDRDNLPATDLLDRLLDYYATVELELACTEESVKRLRAENRTLAMALTAETITDDQIRELRMLMAEERTFERWPTGIADGSVMDVTDLALQGALPTDKRCPSASAIRAARARCAEILNNRAAKEQR